MLETREEQETRIENPYPGLRPFRTTESVIFFGRDEHTDALLKKLKTTQFVAVVGTSGSGKSSLVQAGLLPALNTGLMKGAGSSWRIAIFRPGNNPIGNLAQALSRANLFPQNGKAPVTNQPQADTEKALRRSSLGLIDVVRRAKMSEFENLLVVVDQFEELFRFDPNSTGVHPREEASAFVKLLLEASYQTDLPVYIILTLRSDYLGETAQFWGLPEAINQGQFLIPRMNEDEKREAIKGPVRVFDAEISSTLVNRLLNDVGGDPGQLPILQHALMRTWDYWKGTRSDSEPINIKHYDNPHVGGLNRALSLHADEAYGELTHDQQIIAEKMFKRLTEKRAGKREGRLPATIGEIREIVNLKEREILSVIEVFQREGRSFLMLPASQPLNSATLVDISHESLISGWPRLSKWVEEEADSAKTYGRLVDDALRYPEQAKLLTNPELQSAVVWCETEKPNEVWARRYYTDYGKALASDKPPPRPKWAPANASEFGIAMRYLELSEAAWREAKNLKESKRRRRLLSLATSAVVFLVLALVALWYARSAEWQRALAFDAQKQADKDRKRAEEGEQNAQGQRIISDMFRMSAENHKLLADANAKKAEDALIVARRERALADQRGRQLLNQAKLGRAWTTVLFWDAATSTADVVQAYESMVPFYEKSGIHKGAARTTLNGLIVDAILKDNDMSVTDAFPYFRDNYVKPTETDRETLAYLNLSFAQKIIASGREGLEAVQYLQDGIEGLNDSEDADAKADAFVQLGIAFGNADEAIDAFFSAARLFHAKGRIANEAAAREKIAETQTKRGEPGKARAQYEEALKLFSQLNDDDAVKRIGKQLACLAAQP